MILVVTALTDKQTDRRQTDKTNHFSSANHKFLSTTSIDHTYYCHVLSPLRMQFCMHPSVALNSYAEKMLELNPGKGRHVINALLYSSGILGYTTAQSTCSVCGVCALESSSIKNFLIYAYSIYTLFLTSTAASYFTNILTTST